MTRALVHIGLAAACILAPVLCCCQVRTLGASAHASPIPAPALESCCAKREKADPARSPTSATIPPTKPQPASPRAPQSCLCCAERPAAVKAESGPTLRPAGPTGEFLPLTLAAGYIEHRGLQPPRQFGGNVRFDALFIRHVLRC